MTGNKAGKEIGGEHSSNLARMTQYGVSRLFEIINYAGAIIDKTV